LKIINLEILQSLKQISRSQSFYNYQYHNKEESQLFHFVIHYSLAYIEELVFAGMYGRFPFHTKENQV